MEHIQELIITDDILDIDFPLHLPLQDARFIIIPIHRLGKQPILSQWYHIILSRVSHPQPTSIDWGYIRAYIVWQRHRKHLIDDVIPQDRLIIFKDQCVLKEPIIKYTYPPIYDLKAFHHFHTLQLHPHMDTNELRSFAITAVLLIQKHFTQDPFLPIQPTREQRLWDELSVYLMGLAILTLPTYREAEMLQLPWREAESKRILPYLYASFYKWEAALYRLDAQFIPATDVPLHIRTRIDPYVHWWVRLNDWTIAPLIINRRNHIQLENGIVWLPSYEMHNHLLPLSWKIIPQSLKHESSFWMIIEHPEMIQNHCLPIFRKFIDMIDPSLLKPTLLTLDEKENPYTLQDLKTRHILPACIRILEDRKPTHQHLLHNDERLLYGGVVIHHLGIPLHAVLQNWNQRIHDAYKEKGNSEYNTYKRTWIQSGKYPIRKCPWLMQHGLCPHLSTRMDKNGKLAIHECMKELSEPSPISEIESPLQFIQLQMKKFK